ncbi:hypothetical protein ASF10_03000 [Flavobacterium sp. Leaf82]|nr:hypothetical protein ASF10_03000 [Flavobacterium sp. Leaf82]
MVAFLILIFYGFLLYGLFTSIPGRKTNSKNYFDPSEPNSNKNTYKKHLKKDALLCVSTENLKLETRKL